MATDHLGALQEEQAAQWISWRNYCHHNNVSEYNNRRPSLHSYVQKMFTKFETEANLERKETQKNHPHLLHHHLVIAKFRDLLNLLVDRDVLQPESELSVWPKWCHLDAVLQWPIPGLQPRQEAGKVLQQWQDWKAICKNSTNPNMTRPPRAFGQVTVQKF